MEVFVVWFKTAMLDRKEMKIIDELLGSYVTKNQSIVSVLNSVPVDIFRLGTQLGFAIFPARLTDNIDGLLYVDSKKKIKSYDKIIMFNEKLRNNEAHARFVVAHELGHYIERVATESNADELHDSLAARMVHGQQERSLDERRIDYLAASLLMPRDDVLQYITNNAKSSNSFDFDFYKNMAHHYIVEIDAAKERVKEVIATF